MDILCSECEKRGFPATLLGKTDGMEGKIRLWCKNCRCEIEVTIHNRKVSTRKI
jgi:hypothetical protein